MTRVNRTLVAAAAAIGMSTGAVALIPTVMSPTSSVVPTVSAADLADMYDAAQAEFHRGNATAGLSGLRTLLAADPGDTDALALQAFWSDYCADRRATQSALTALDSLDRAKADRVRGAIAAINRGVTVGPDPVPRYYPATTGVVVLGAGLRPDGGPTDETASRLFAAWTQAIMAWQSPIIVSGGSTQRGRLEAAVMRDWLVDHAIPVSRIHLESRALTIPQNASLTAGMVDQLHLRNVVLVTSPDQIRRAASDFLIAGTQVIGATTSTRNLAASAAVPSKVNQKVMYQDATVIVGIPAGRAASGPGVAPAA